MQTFRLYCFFLPTALLAHCLFSSPAIAEEATPAEKDENAKWQSMFDSKKLGKWAALKKDEFEQAGKVHIRDGAIVMEAGDPATGIHWTGKFPKQNYELIVEGKRIKGDDFFCGLTFPVSDGSLTLIMGGRGGWVVGLSCIDGFYAIDNDTCTSIKFKQNQWYKIRLRVTAANVGVWVDKEKVIALETERHKLAASEEMQRCLPVGVATWKTTGAIRDLKFRMIDPKK